MFSILKIIGSEGKLHFIKSRIWGKLGIRNDVCRNRYRSFATMGLRMLVQHGMLGSGYQKGSRMGSLGKRVEVPCF